MTEIASFAPCLDVVSTADPRRTFLCPEPSSNEDLRCVKIRNPDPNATWDFLMMLIRQQLEGSALISHIVPLENGGWRRFSNRVHTRDVQKIHSLETYESESLNFGFVNLSKSKTRKFYLEIRQHLFVAQGLVQDFDAENRPVGPPVEIDDSLWPDLPGDQEISDLIRSLVTPAAPQGQSGPAVGPLVSLDLGVHFPTVTELDDGDFEVADGEVFAAATRAERPENGIVIETSFQQGIPALATHDYFVVENGEKVQRLFGDRCAQNVIKEIIVIYRKKKSSGFFRSKQKLTIVRDELRINTFTWTST